MGDEFPSSGGGDAPADAETSTIMDEAPTSQPVEGDAAAAQPEAADEQRLQPVPFRLPEEAEVAKQMKEYVKTAPSNPPSLASLDPVSFVKRVLIGDDADEGERAIDDGDSAQPIFFRMDGSWLLHSAEILYRVRDPNKVPFPAFVSFVQAASDVSKDVNQELRDAFQQHSTASLRRVDALLSEMQPALRDNLEREGFRFHLNFTSRQLEGALALPIENPKLIALEETEYDMEPEGMPEVRRRVWERFGYLSLDDVQATMADVRTFADVEFEYGPPLTPSGHPYKPMLTEYRHDFPRARQFMADFAKVRSEFPDARSSLKLNEEFCCYILGVGYAPFSRAAMADWRKAYPEASAAVRRAGATIIREALECGMHVCCEVSFEDQDVQWLVDEIPELEHKLLKQGGHSGPSALPVSLIEATWFTPKHEDTV